MSHAVNPSGVGIAYRFCLHRQIMSYASDIDLLEIPTEDYIVRSRRMMVDPQLNLLNEAVDRIPCVAHGIHMSIGSVEPFDQPYLDSTLAFLQQTGIDVFSEHLTFHRMNNVDLETFLPMPFTEESADWVAQKYNVASDFLGRPFALENVSYFFPVPDCTLSESEFLIRLLEKTDCSLLLDVTNVFNNATNHGYDAEQFIKSLPGNRISQIHLAGGRFVDNMWIDDHSSAVMPGVWPLLELALEHTAAQIVILERDANFDPFDAVLDDIRQARQLFRKHRTMPVGASPVKRDLNQPADKLEQPDVQHLPDGGDFDALRQFQIGLLHEITLRDELANQDSVGREPEWQHRIANCDPERLKMLKRKWEKVESRAQAEQKEYQNREWQLWRQSLNMR
ncbi:MAG: DUF692 domain-containing protein [Pirellulaceae bacterium]